MVYAQQKKQIPTQPVLESNMILSVVICEIIVQKDNDAKQRNNDNRKTTCTKMCVAIVASVVL